MSKDFYIGWMTEAPHSYAAFIKKLISFLIPAVIIIGLILAVSQKKFGNGTFEFGKLTEVKGVFYSKPFPHLEVLEGVNFLGDESFMTIPLVGYGKFGAEGIVSGFEHEIHRSIEGMMVALKGTLLYSDGKLLMQIDGNDKPIKTISDFAPSNKRMQQTDLGDVMLTGEIVDPKCFFGVMKPGEGKPHKDCAIRCILGGIPPVLRVKDKEGRSNYYIILIKDRQQITKYVGQPVRFAGHAVQYNDWIVLFANDDSRIEFISGRSLFDDRKEVTCLSRRPL